MSAQDAVPGVAGTPWASTRRELSGTARWVITIVGTVAGGFLSAAAVVLMSPAFLVLAFVPWWFVSVVVTGYRPATAEQKAALPGTTLWHVTRTRAWPNLPTSGDVVTFAPKRCRWWSRMYRARLLPHIPRKAVYVTRRHPRLMPRWGFPTRSRNVTLTLELADPTPPVGTFARVDGAIAFTAETRLRVVAVNVKEQS